MVSTCLKKWQNKYFTLKKWGIIHETFWYRQILVSDISVWDCSESCFSSLSDDLITYSRKYKINLNIDDLSRSRYSGWSKCDEWHRLFKWAVFVAGPSRDPTTLSSNYIIYTPPKHWLSRLGCTDLLNYIGKPECYNYEYN